jgi:uncharacterized protein YbgA (DUF1722 family)
MEMVHHQLLHHQLKQAASPNTQINSLVGVESYYKAGLTTLYREIMTAYQEAANHEFLLAAGDHKMKD